jgi:hypothetical protein
VVDCVELIGCGSVGVGERSEPVLALAAAPRLGTCSCGRTRTRLAPEVVVVAQRRVTVTDILDGHVVLDLECFDRIYLNGWVHTLQVSGQVVNFLTHHLGFPIPSPAILEKIGLGFRKAVTAFAADNDLAVIRFAKGERKLEVMRPYLDRLIRQQRTGVAAIGVAQEFQRVFTGTTYHPDADGGGLPRFGYHKADRRVTAYYFYLVDDVFGPAFIKVCSHFPYPIKIWLNGTSTPCETRALERSDLTIWRFDRCRRCSSGPVLPTVFADFDDLWRPFLGGQGPAPGYGDGGRQ